VCVFLGIQPRALGILNTQSNTELHLQSSLSISWSVIWENNLFWS
jgi:hypothetical protein